VENNMLPVAKETEATASPEPKEAESRSNRTVAANVRGVQQNTTPAQGSTQTITEEDEEDPKNIR